ncbi:MAG: hypothetical protein ACOCYE_09595, partial [Pseudomonadota bacterium]
TPLDAGHWLSCLAVGGAVFVLVEAEKLLRRRRLVRLPSRDEHDPAPTRPEREANGRSAQPAGDHRAAGAKARSSTPHRRPH